MTSDPWNRRRHVPEHLKGAIPPHPLEFVKDDTDAGRICSRCGFSVPGGFKHAHYTWCDEQVATAKSTPKISGNKE